jgi:hypothetical protein
VKRHVLYQADFRCGFAAGFFATAPFDGLFEIDADSNDSEPPSFGRSAPLEVLKLLIRTGY